MQGNLIDSRKIGSSIKALRLANHLTQEELASRVGYSVRNLRRIENLGTGSIDIVNYFAETFKVSALDILNGCFLFIKNLLRNTYWRPSSYITYSNLLFVHVQFRLSCKQLPHGF